MGFFDEMLAGGLAGAGKGMSDYAATREREEAMRAQLEAQNQLKREMMAEQLAAKKELQTMRYGDGSGALGASGGSRRSSGGGGSDSFFDQMLQTAKTPEDIDKTIRYAQLRMGPDAAAATAEYFGRPMQEQVTSPAPTTGDLARFDRGQQDTVPEAVTSTRNAGYDKDKGAAALNRLIAMADPGKFDDYTKGERNVKLMDNADAVTGKKMTLEQAEIEQSLSNPTSDPNKIDASERMNDARIAAKKSSGGGGKGVASANNIFKTVTDESGNVMGVKRDGTKVDLGIKSDSFNKQVSALVTKMNDNEGGGFRKLPEDQKRAKATERLLGRAPSASAPAAPATDRLSQFKVIRN